MPYREGRLRRIRCSVVQRAAWWCGGAHGRDKRSGSLSLVLVLSRGTQSLVIGDVKPRLHRAGQPGPSLAQDSTPQAGERGSLASGRAAEHDAESEWLR